MYHEHNSYDYRHHFHHYFHLLHVMDNNVMLQKKQNFISNNSENNLHSVKHTSHVVDKHSQGPNEQVSSCPNKNKMIFIIR